MLEWNSPRVRDASWVKGIIEKSGQYGSDTSFANIFLLRNKYNIEICGYKDFFVRKYHGKGTRNGYTFPIGNGNLGAMIDRLEEDAIQRGERLSFCFLTEEQKVKLERIRPGHFDFSSDPGDWDYVYRCRDLADLPGKPYHKKKNHVSKFRREYPDFEYCEIGACNPHDAAAIADEWYNQHPQDEGGSQLLEYMSIKEALENFDELGLMGGIIYVKGSPVAMTIASYINPETVDVHFEKSIGEFAENGGYAAINNFFAKGLSNVEIINREEDINIEGLRKAKMSYHPVEILKKYHGVLR